MQMKQGVPVNDHEGLEHGADMMGAKALNQAAGDKKIASKKSFMAAISK